MTHRQRILAALDHRSSDRLPVDFGGTESTGILAIAYHRLKQHLGLSGGKTQIYDLMQMLAKVEPAVLDRTGSDTLPLLLEPLRWKPWTFPDGTPAEIPAPASIETLDDGRLVQRDEAGHILSQCPPDGFYFDPVHHPLADIQDPAELHADDPCFQGMDWPACMDEPLSSLADRARKLHEQTDRAIVANLWVHVFAAGHALRGYEQFMLDLLDAPALAEAVMARQVEAYLPRIDRYLDAVGPYVDVIQVNDDLGSQTGPLLSPELYRRLVKPHHHRLWSYIRQRSDKPLLLHSCGSVDRFIPDFIDMGVDALNPVQVSAAGMDTARLKREFGRDLCFWGGGCDTQHVLARGTPEQVREEVCRRIDDLAADGGFVFCQVHNIQPDVPPENILAMFDAVRDHTPQTA